MTTTGKPAPIAPERRSQALDTVRGLAVLGILVVNVGFVAMPFFAVSNPTIWGGHGGLDELTFYVQVTFFDGKMRGLFSMLFGAGLWLQWTKAEREGTAAGFGDVWSRRCLWLVLFGLVHGYLLQWAGDILFAYGIAGLFLFPLRLLGSRALIALATILLTIGFAFDAVALVGRGEDARGYTEAIAVREHGGTLDDDQQAAIARWERNHPRKTADSPPVQELLTAFRSGWTASAAVSAEFTAYLQTSYFVQHMFWDTLGLMLLGIVLARSRWLQGQGGTRSYVTAMVVGYGVAAPVVWSLAMADHDANFSALEIGTEWARIALYHPTRIAIGLAHAAALLLVLRSRLGETLLRPLAAVGRAALSNYILQTLLCTTWFFGFGFGFYGELSRFQQMLFVAGVWAIAMIWSPLWLRRFRFGPLEWAWRSLVHWRRQPMRRSREP